MTVFATESEIERQVKQARNLALAIRNYAQRASDRLAGVVQANEILDADISLRERKTQVQAFLTIPGLDAQARITLGQGAGYVFTAELSQMITAMDNVLTRIRADFPKTADANEFLLAQQWGANGPVWRSFPPTAAAMISLRAAFDALIATVE